MKKKLMSAFLMISSALSAQQYVHQVFVLNEGYFDYVTGTIQEPVILGSYNPLNQNYAVIDTLENMRFASDMVIGDSKLYVAADQHIYSYDLITNQLIGTIDIPGVRNLAFHANKLVATRGEYLTTYDSYVHVYDATTLQLMIALDTVTGPKWASQNIVVNGDLAYIAVNNAYEWGNEKGVIGILDLNTLTYGNEIDLGVDGKNPDNLVMSNGYIYSVNNKDWSGASISKINVLNNAVTTSSISTAITGCGTSCLRNDNIYYQISGETSVNEWNAIAMAPVGPVSNLAMNFYEIIENPISNEFYGTTTDYLTNGTVHIFDNSNNLTHSFAVGVSPGTLLFDVRSSAGMSELSNEYVVYPIPASNELFIDAYSGKAKILSTVGNEVSDVFVELGGKVDVSSLSSGVYVLMLENASQSIRFIKE